MPDSPWLRHLAPRALEQAHAYIMYLSCLKIYLYSYFNVQYVILIVPYIYISVSTSTVYISLSVLL